ncbi:MAG: hypothetical protein AB7E63_04050 [Parachlamydia sp.]|jgi:hypothetical protein
MVKPIKSDAPACYRPCHRESVCGIREVDFPELSQMGSKLYLIEFDSGEAIEIPEIYLTHFAS